MKKPRARAASRKAATRNSDSGHDMLAALERATFKYFDRECSSATGLVRDSTREGAPATIAGSGLALACYVVAAERGYAERTLLARRTRVALEFLWHAEQSDRPNATGYNGFFYHFLDLDSGTRAHRSEVSTIDSAFLFAGALVAAAYFDGPGDDERTIRRLAIGLYERADWRWASPRPPAVGHGWKPESGFLRYDWRGYNEGLLLYILALGSPTYSVDATAYDEWTSTYQWKTLYGIDFLYGGPLFIHQASHAWLDLRGVRDDFMRAHASDYFENSRRAAYVQREYARRNPRNLIGYGEHGWGITASDGPGPAVKTVRGRRRRFYDYLGRGVPYGPDDGTLSPWAVVASLPFAPEIVVPTLKAIDRDHPDVTGKYGYKCSYNPTFGGSSAGTWISQGFYAIDQGPVVLMIENVRSGLIWRLLRNSEHIRTGLQRAGFRGGWLGAESAARGSMARR